MTYSTLKLQVGRKPITVVEIDVDFCSNTYGSAPCTAAVGTTGAQKCYNTFGGCQDTANYAKTTKTYRFCTQTTLLPVGTNILPCVLDVDTVPTKIDTKGLSERAVLKIRFKDFPHHDRGIDPYVNEDTLTSGRSDTPADQRGTFWGKFIARNKFLVNRPVRIKRGYIGANGLDTSFSTDFQTELYFIDRVELNRDGTATLVAKDILKFAENKNAKAPAPSEGELNAGISAGATSLTLNSGAGAAYGTSGKVRINDEIMSFAGRSTDTLTGLTRGTDGTTAAAHDAGDLVQLCLEYSSDPVQDILEDLLQNYAGVSASYIPKTDWDAEATDFLSSYSYSTVLSEPTGVQELVQEITNHSGINLWWDNVDQEIKLKAISQPLATTSIVSLTDDDIIRDSMRVRVLEKERLSRVIVLFEPISQVADFGKQSSYSQANVIIDADAETSNEYGSESSRLIKSRWMPSDAVVNDMASRLLNRLRNAPRELTFRLDAKDSGLKTGDQFFYTGRYVQDEDGNNKPLKYLVTQSREVEHGSIWEFTAVEFASLSGTTGLVGPNTLNDFTSESDANKLTYAFVCNASELMSDGSPGYRIQ